MLTNAARGDFGLGAPRSRSGRAALCASPMRAARAAVVCAIATVSSCGGDASTAPRSATYVATLSGASERPARPTTGAGTATFRVVGTQATYEVRVSGLAGDATVAHVAIGGRETAVGQIVLKLSFVAPSGTVAAGAIDLSGAITFNNSTISGDSLRSLFDRGTAYVNVYTTAFPGGEVRGQIVRRAE